MFNQFLKRNIFFVRPMLPKNASWRFPKFLTLALLLWGRADRFSFEIREFTFCYSLSAKFLQFVIFLKLKYLEIGGSRYVWVHNIKIYILYRMQSSCIDKVIGAQRISFCQCLVESYAINMSQIETVLLTSRKSWLFLRLNHDQLYRQSIWF